MTQHTTGTKYDATKDLDIAAIAKLVRADIKAAVAAGELPAGLKVSVRIDRFAGGQSLDVSILEAPFNPVCPFWAQMSDEGRSYRAREERFTAEAVRVEDVLAAIHAAYNYDKSDTQVDYFNVRYYGQVSWSWQYLTACQAEAAARPVEAVVPIDFAEDFGPAMVAAVLAEYITEAAPEQAGASPTLGTVIPFRPRQVAEPLPAVAGELAPCIAGPAVRVVNEDAARFAFFLGLDD